MKKFKFRTWDKLNKTFIEPVFTHISLNDIFAANKTHVFQQFTGLKDLNGQEIYEGDILTNDTKEKLEVKFGELPLDKGSDCVCSYPAFYCKNYGKLGASPYHECEQIGSWMTVTGSIFENPELLQ